MDVPILFQAPWLLAGLAVLPFLWWLLRHRPPEPQHTVFPGVWLLERLRDREETPHHLPLWLLALRLAILAALIVGLARPVLNPAKEPLGEGPLLLLIENDWAAGPDWARRVDAARRWIDTAKAAGRGVILMPTNRPPGTPATPDTALERPNVARAALTHLAPRPWPSDHQGVLESLRAARLPDTATAVWLSSGLRQQGTTELAGWLQRLGSLTVVAPPPSALPPAIGGVASTGSGIEVTVRRANASAENRFELHARDPEGRIVSTTTMTSPAGEHETGTTLHLPAAIQNRIAVIEIAGLDTPVARFLMDDQHRHRRIGVLTPAREAPEPLISPLYYVEKALAPRGQLKRGTLSDLDENTDVLILPDRSLTPETVTAFEDWIRSGGVLLRFAGGEMAAGGDGLTPLPLRHGGRHMGSLLAWDEPAKLAPFPDDGPFAGLGIPDDVAIYRQVLAEPLSTGEGRIWARLSDGTPLVTARRMGDGWLVLIHVTGGPEGSSLPFSGLFVQMLERIVMLAQSGGGPEARDTPLLMPQEVMDGYGRLTAPPAGVTAVAAKAWAETRPSPAHPPGRYGSRGFTRALNLAGTVSADELMPIGDLPVGVVHQTYGDGSETALMPAFLLLALILTLVDLMILGGRRLLPLHHAATVLLIGLLLAPETASAAARKVDMGNSFAAYAAAETRLAYVKTGNPATDRLSAEGLASLSQILQMRTAVEPGEPVGVNIGTDEIIFFPVLYWPVSPPYDPLPPALRDKLNAYLNTGGLLIIDTGDRANLGASLAGGALADFLGPLSLPHLTPMSENHVLTKTFYLLHSFPGRWPGERPWVTATSNTDESVSPIIIGNQGWAAAWAIDREGRPRVPIMPGGRGQQEMAHRVGINIVMYALTGTYKADQVHVPALLERLGQ